MIFFCIEIGSELDLVLDCLDLGVLEFGLFGLGTQCFGLELGLNLS